MEKFTWADLAKAISQLSDKQLENEVYMSIEDEGKFRLIHGLEKVQEDVFVNIHDNDDVGTMPDLKEAHGEDFKFKSYRLLTPKGLPFLWDGF